MNPYLPVVGERLGASHTRRHRAECGREFYVAALELAQSFCSEGKPAQAVLQLNKAFLADLRDDEGILAEFPWPYTALGWFLENRGVGFLGNPVRHFQHLASRMAGPRAELRAVRAWVCFHLAEEVLDGAEFPRDGVQIEGEDLVIPELRELVGRLRGWGREREAEVVAEVFGRLEEGLIGGCHGGDAG